MKKTFGFIALAAILFTACQKSDMQQSSKDDGMEVLQNVTFTANITDLSAPQSKAFTPKTDGEGTSVNRCVMEIYLNNNFYGRYYEPIDVSHPASFSLKLPSFKTYDVLFWADHVDAAATTPTASELVTDKYYVTNSDAGLKNVSINGPYAGNDDARDAFFAYEECTVDQQSGSPIAINLTRPFAQVNVYTTDAKQYKNATAPESVTLTLKNVSTSFNVKTGEASNKSDCQYTAPLYEFPSQPEHFENLGNVKLSMDYIFADAEQSAIDIVWQANATQAIVHNLTNIPYRRNYRTNVVGSLLTTSKQWNVSITPGWTDPAVTKKIASTLADAQGYVETNSSDEVVVTVTQEAADNATASDVVTVGGKNYLQFILKTTSPQTVGFELPPISQSVQSSLNVDTWLVTYQTGYPTENVVVEAADGSKVKIEAPNSHVEVIGTSYAEITASTDDNTLVIPAGVTVTNLIIQKGGLEIHGTVSNVTVSVTDPDKVYVRACEKLSQTVYDVLKQYIAVGYVAVKDLSEAGKWDIVPDTNYEATIGNVGYEKLKGALDAVQNNEVVKLLKNIELASTITCNRDVTFKFNLNNKTIHSEEVAFDIKSGIMTIVGNGKILKSDTGQPYWLFNVRTNGKLVVGESGMQHDIEIGEPGIVSANEVTIWSGTISETHCFSYDRNSSFVINGGKIKAFDNGGMQSGSYSCTIYLNGGIYGENPALEPTSEYKKFIVKSGYKVAENPDVQTKTQYPWTIVVDEIVHEVNDPTSLLSALNTALAGEVIKLTANIQMTSTLNVTKAVILDLNNYTLSTSGLEGSSGKRTIIIGSESVAGNYEVTIRNGLIRAYGMSSGYPLVNVYTACKFKNVDIQTVGIPVQVRAEVTVSIEGDNTVMTSNGTNSNKAYEAAVIVTKNGTANISAGTFTGNTYAAEVAMSGGKLNITGGIFNKGSVGNTYSLLNDANNYGEPKGTGCIIVSDGTIIGDIRGRVSDAPEHPTFLYIYGGTFDIGCRLYNFDNDNVKLYNGFKKTDTKTTTGSGGKIWILSK